MNAPEQCPRQRPVAHLVGSIPLPDSESVFRTLARTLGGRVVRLPDGETGIRRSWIRFLQDVLAAHPAIEVAHDLPPFAFRQWDGKLIREIPRLRATPGAAIDAAGFVTGYAAMALDSWRVFDSLQRAGTIAPDVKFQICLPTPIAPLYNNMVPADRPAVLPGLTAHFVGEVEQIAAALPHDRIAIQWDVCQEVLAWEGYYEAGPADFRSETLETLAAAGDAVPEDIELGYHFCYGSPADEHLVQPRDAGILVEMANSISPRVARSIDFVHFPVPRTRSDDAYFEPFAELALEEPTQRYFGLIHYDDASGDATRLATALRFARVDGVATECGMARGDPARLDALLAAHLTALEVLEGRAKA